MRAASARVAAATSSNGAPRTGTTTCTPFEPLVFTAPDSPASSSARRTSRAARTTTGKSAPSGGSRSSTRPVGLGVPGPEEGDVELDGALVGQPQQRAPVVAQHLGDLAVRTLRPHGTVRTQSGAPLDTLRCMNGACPGRTRLTDSGRPASSGTIRSATASR